MEYLFRVYPSVDTRVPKLSKHRKYKVKWNERNGNGRSESRKKIRV